MSNLFKHIIFIISLCNGLLLQGQLQLNQISRINGLSQNTVNSIIQDNDGFLWIATYNGINKYDGYSMNYFDVSNKNLSSNLIHNLFIAAAIAIAALLLSSGPAFFKSNDTLAFFNNSICLNSK